ncbi:b3 domain-containing protein, partial [Quercus suber]
EIQSPEDQTAEIIHPKSHLTPTLFLPFGSLLTPWLRLGFGIGNQETEGNGCARKGHGLCFSIQDWGLGLEAKKRSNARCQSRKHCGSHPPPILPPEFKDVINTLNGRDELLGNGCARKGHGLCFSIQDWGLGLEAKKRSNARCQSRKQLRVHPPPILPPEFKDVINTLNGRDELLDFLSEQEKEKNLEHGKKKEIPARLVDPKLQIFNDVVLIQWDMPKDTGNTSSTYALRTGWNNVRLSNDLKEGDLVQLWSFRVGQQACEDASSSSAINRGQLCFALVLL